MNKKILLYGLMVLFLSLFLSFLIMDISIFKISYITDKLDESKYYDNLYSNIYNKFEETFETLNIDGVDINKIVDKSMIKNDIQNYITGYYKKESYILHTIEIETKLNSFIENYNVNHKVEVDDEELVSNEVNGLLRYYEKQIKAENVLEKVSSSFMTFKGICVPIMIISLMSIVGTYLYMIFVYNIKPLGKVFMASSALIFITQVLLQKFLSLKSLYTNELIKESLNLIKNDVLLKFDIVCILLFIGGLIFFIFEKMFERK